MTYVKETKAKNVLTPRLLHLLHIPNQKWEEISMDSIEGLPMSEGKDKILAVVDRLTKYVHFIGVRRTNFTKQIVEVFCKMFTSHMGFPKSSSVIEMPNLKGIFGESFANKLGRLLI